MSDEPIKCYYCDNVVTTPSYCDSCSERIRERLAAAKKFADENPEFVKKMWKHLEDLDAP